MHLNGATSRDLVPPRQILAYVRPQLAVTKGRDVKVEPDEGSEELDIADGRFDGVLAGVFTAVDQHDVFGPDGAVHPGAGTLVADIAGECLVTQRDRPARP